MSNIWRFKIELKQEDVFDKIQERIGKKFPDELRNFIIKYNAASPDENCIVINGVERVVNTVLSFNEIDTEAITYMSVAKVINKKSLIPFAADPFGNYFCYSLEKKEVVFFNHEEQTFEESGDSLQEFVNKLY